MEMACPSEILARLTLPEKKSLAGLVAVSLPADDLVDGLWSVTFLEDILQLLGLDKDLAEGFHPLTARYRRGLPRPVDERVAWEQNVEPFRASLPPLGEPRSVVLRDLMVIVALRCGYDARTRITFRRVCEAMQVPWHPRASEVESTLARKVYERVNRDRERELRTDRWRGLKIGAAMIGGGTLLAVTGGLAAPALAAGLAASSSVIGATAAATLSGFATTAWMATLFGAGGAGLVGYKMDRRTKGVKEFEFESETTVGEEMSVSICVPGVLKDKADLQRGWGVEPRGPDVSALERLRRFYYVYNRSKVGDVEDILVAYDGKESKLCRGLVDRYGADPRNPPTREALARMEGRSLEGVSQEDVARDAEAIEQLMEITLRQEKEETKKYQAKAKAAEKVAKVTGGDAADRWQPSAAAAAGSTGDARRRGDDGEPAAAAPADPFETATPAAAAAAAATVPEAAPTTTATATPVAPIPATATTEAAADADAGEGAGESGSLLRDWDRGADGQVEALRLGVDGLSIPSADAVGGGGAGAGADGGAAVKDEIEIFVEADGIAEGEDGGAESRKEDKDLLKHRVWFWQDKLPHTDQYVLRWESDWLVTLGKSVQTIIKSLSQSAMQETLKYTTLAAIMTSLAWPLALITLSSMIDADWTIGRERADVAGKILADALLNREQGCRPVTLVGTSLGARLIFACLEEIARRHELWEEQMMEADGRRGRRGGHSKAGGGGVGGGGGKFKENDAKCAAGVIENVCLLGAPVEASSARWERVARMVHGRIVNGYSKSDIILGLVFRAKSLSLSVSGIQKVSAAGVENLDLTSVIGSSHFNYNRKMPEILELLDLDNCSTYIARGDPREEPPSAAPAGFDGDGIVFGTTIVP